jgi:hypothetical protein
MGLGCALWMQGDHEGAEAAFHCALAIDPTNPEVQARLRAAATHKGLEEEAKGAAAQQAMMELLLEEEEGEHREGAGQEQGAVVSSKPSQQCLRASQLI